MKNFKKVVALGMTAVMMAGNSLPVFAAADGQTESGTAVTGEGTGTDIYVDKDVYKLECPTNAALAKIFDYTVDPQGLIAATEAIEFGGATIEGEGLFFANKDATDATKTVKLSNWSDPMKLTNKGAIPVDIACEAKLADAASDPYAGTFSATADFSGTSDKTAGLYFGVYATQDVEYSFSKTEKAFNNMILSGVDGYEVKYDANATPKYSFGEKTNYENWPVYEFYIHATLNPDVAETTWATRNADGSLDKVLNAPKISVKFTPTAVNGAKEAIILVEDTDFYVSKPDGEGGFGTTKPTAITVNGKTITSIKDNVDGYVHFTWDDVYKAYGFTKEEDIPDADELYGAIKCAKITAGGVVYYAEIQ
jgi:hypothetical protein